MKADVIGIKDYVRDSDGYKPRYEITRLLLTLKIDGKIVTRDMLSEVKRWFNLAEKPQKSIITMVKHNLPDTLGVYLYGNTFYIQSPSFIRWRKRFDSRRDYVFNRAKCEPKHKSSRPLTRKDTI